MIAALMVATLAGCFALARWYGAVAALAALGLSWGTFAWFPATLGIAVPVAFVVVGGLLLVAVLRDRRGRTP